MNLICPLCGREFTPSKYRPNSQRICSDPLCQRSRQLGNMKKWRGENPHYFKMDETRSAHWIKVHKERIKKWRKKNPDYFKNYRKKYKDRHKNYMREYMRRYRLRRGLVAKPPAALPAQPPTPTETVS